MFIKQNGINLKFQKFRSKLQLAYHVCSFVWMTSLMSRQVILRKIENTVKLCIRIVLHKINKKKTNKQKKNATKSRGEMFFTLTRMASPTSNWKFCDTITSWKLIKTPKNFVQDSCCKTLTKYVVKTGLRFCPQFPFKFLFNRTLSGHRFHVCLELQQKRH